MLLVLRAVPAGAAGGHPMSSDWAAIVLAAGQGKRMRSSRPKILHTILGRPMVEWVIAALHGAGAAKVVLVLSPADHQQIASSLHLDGISVALQSEPLGTALAARCAQAELNGWHSEIVVACGDSPLLRSETVSGLLTAHRHSGAALTLATARAGDPTGYGRIKRDESDRPCAIVEEAAAHEDDRLSNEVNSGLYCFSPGHLWRWLAEIKPSAAGEYYLTDALELAYQENAIVAEINSELTELAGVNDRAQLAEAARQLQTRINTALMRSGVTMIDPLTTWVEPTVHLAPDVTLMPGVLLRGQTVIEAGAEIGPNSEIVDSRIGPRSQVRWSVIEQATVGAKVTIGPFSHLRPGTIVADGVHIGNFAEVKNSRLGPNTKMGHFSYLGDAEVGAEVNIGAGTITCNYDAESDTKNKTVIGDYAAIGSDTMLVAPVSVGAGAVTGAGSVVTHDLKPGDVAIGAPARVVRQSRRKLPKGNDEFRRDD